MQRPSLVIEPAPAKINLALHVTGKREDGYHDLESLVVFAELGDELHAFRAENDSLKLSGPFGSALTNGQSNLVLKAIKAFRENWPDAVPHGVEIELHKNLPVSAGIGGGSADAAAALRLMASLSQQSISLEDMMPIATKLGADVPVCLFSQPCQVAGLGERVHKLDDFPHGFLVMANPLIAIGTADVFKRLEKRDNAPLPQLPEPLHHISLLALWLEETRNDLEPPAIDVAPVIGEIDAALRQTRGCIKARMSGSGATVFGLYGSSAEAFQAAADIRARWPDFWVAASPMANGV